VAEDGRDEVAALGASFNQAATRIEALLQSHKSLLANASHELRSPLARLKMAVSMLEDAAPAQRAAMRREIDVNIGELDALVEEVLLASRLDASAVLERQDDVDLLGLAAEEAARVNATVQGDAVQLRGDERLIRRALRNLLENARRYGGGEVELSVQRRRAGRVAGLRPRPGRARGLSRAHLRTLLPPARPCREGRWRGPGAGAGAPDRRAPRRRGALRAARRRRQLLHAGLAAVRSRFCSRMTFHSTPISSVIARASPAVLAAQ
jgi:two-component system sensor histidine kinase RstB